MALKKNGRRRVALAMCMAACAGTAGAVSNKLDCAVTWVGNDSSGKTEWTPHNVDGVFVTPEGVVYTNSGWEEAAGEVMRFDRDGKWMGPAMHTHGWGYYGDTAIAVNSKYVFIAQRAGHCKDAKGEWVDTWPDAGFGWSGVSRRSRANFFHGAPFEGGKGGKGDTLRNSFKKVIEVAHGGNHAWTRGICASETEVFFAVEPEDTVYVFDAETMEEKRRLNIERPDRMAFDVGQTTLWMLQAPEDPANTAR